ncbi:uncharacterized protein LOC143885601 [Tasmannia lanceolata]|uniref:uncharacterized protein LOC143885601 n=1 Tax=Tasmannia lanceolata TaxID=3420 RepID=UPI0040639479
MKRHFSDTLMEWNRRGPLEVIYEEYEGEEEEGESPEWEKRRVGIAIYYPDSDSGSSWDGEEFPLDFPVIEGWDSPENLCFVWEEEKEGLIEIPLGGKGKVGFEVEEENLIEIDLFSVGN